METQKTNCASGLVEVPRCGRMADAEFHAPIRLGHARLVFSYVEISIRLSSRMSRELSVKAGRGGNEVGNY